MYEVSREALDEAAYRADLDPDTAIRADYSGRWMYGDLCFGLIHDSQGELLKFALALVREDEDAEEWLPNSRGDLMGRSQITYWPGVTVKEDE